VSSGSIGRFATLCLLGLSLLATTTHALADPGSLDTTFGGDGKVITPFLPQDASAWAVTFQPDGKVVVAGGAGPDLAFALARYDTEGTLDASFGVGGKVTTQFPEAIGSASVVAIQPDGKIIAGGSGALARYTTEGTLDPSFGGGDGVVVVQGQVIEIQTDGKILVASQGALARYGIEGTFDPSFGGGDGTVAVDGYILDIAIQADGKIVAIRNQAIVTRYNPDGSLDTSFGDGGSVSPHFGDYDWMNVVAVESDGTILAGGGSETCYGGGTGCDDYYTLFRFTADGAPQSTVGGWWKVMQEVQGIAIQANAKIILAGPSGEGRFALVRLKIDGTPDTRFAADGIRFIRFNRNSGTLAGVALDADGRIVVFGTAEGAVHSKFALARYLAA
jgi:uncharacterized delta-60 repeat protein